MNPATVIGVIVVAILSITSHEAAHGFVADRLGDPTAREHGRLTLNPIPHIDPFFTILLPLVLILSHAGFIFGGAKPVPVNVSRLRRPRRDWALVGAAGPAMNILIAIVLTAVLAAATSLGLASWSSSLAEILTVGIFLNALLAVFNLIPIPPLDGSRVVQYFLSGEALVLYRRLEQFGLLIIIALVFLIPQIQLPLSQAIFGLVAAIATPLHVWPAIQQLLQRLLAR
ncbi:MAG: site-2 protease family protein [Vicinamibacterales bacterium]